MKTVLMRLEGPLQAWSTQSRLGIRDTDPEPSKSGVLGLVGAALGMERTDDTWLSEVAGFEMAVRVDRPGSLLKDYHTAGGSTFRGAPYFVFGTKNTVTSNRYYLQDASFLVGLEAPGEWATRLEGALRDPKWPVFLGRRACPPSKPILEGVVDGSPPEAVAAGAPADRAGPRLRIVVESSEAEGGEPRYDVPISFRPGERSYGVRYVRSEWVTLESRDDDADDDESRDEQPQKEAS